MTIAAIGYGTILLVGIVAGATGRITVFADLHDLLATFAIVVVAGGAVWLLVSNEPLEHEAAVALAAGIGGLAAIFVVWRAWRANRSLLATLLAVATKLPFALGVPLLVIEFVTPSGDSARTVARARCCS